MKIIFILLAFISSRQVFAYANFIGHGYTSCLNCHFNPFGGGQLNDYGRAVSATGISSRALYPDKVSEEQLAHLSGFLFRPPKQDWLRTQINYRGFNIIKNPGGSQEEKSWITMQADVRATLKFGENDKFIISGDYGQMPIADNVLPGVNDSRYRSRSHYVGFRFSKKVGVYAGLMDKVYGIRILEHTAYSRVDPQVTQNDQTHGVVLHYLDDKWEGGLHGFAGNLGQQSPIRMKGFSGMLERTVSSFHRVGASVQKSGNDFFDLTSYALHGRFSVKDGSAILTEIGQTNRKTFNGTDDRTARYGLLQTYVRPFRGLYIFANMEYEKNNLNLEDYSVRIGPGVQYFPIQRLELRMDLMNSRYYYSSSAVKDSWTLLLQTHVWL